MRLGYPISCGVLGAPKRRGADSGIVSRGGRKRSLCSTLSRRELVCAVGAGAVVSVLSAWSQPAFAGKSVKEALEELLAGKTAVESTRVRLDLPPQFDYGNTVPLAFTVDRPMSEANRVERVSVFAEGNPFPEVARFHFTSDSGHASAATRIRLNEGRQEVAAVAELNDGSAWLARRPVEVGVSGCSVETGVVIGYPMPQPEPRVKVPEGARRGEIIEVRTMISHWMETGFRIDATGKPIPRRIINRMVCSRGGEPIFAADLSPAIAANAYLNFSIVAREPAVLTFVWVEDGGAVYRATHSLTVT
jgi:thiosulfate oxidation carrier complex protein SoxZ